MQAEPVSPELVLVDPELAARERARLEEKARFEEILAVAALRRAVEHQITRDEAPARGVAAQRGWHVGEFTRSRLLLATLLGCVLASGLLVAGLVAGADETATVGAPVAERPATLLPTWTAAGATAPPSRIERRSRATKATAAVVERRLIERILAAPRRHLPRAFVEPRTGLVKNNVQVACRRATTLSFRCTVRLARSATKSIVVRYRMERDGTGEFTWQTSRSG